MSAPIGRSETAICVLGMHRSGTSCLTGLLEDAGVYLGPVSRQNPYNPKGNQEYRAIMDLHNAVLAANGGAWDHPPESAVNWNEEHKAALQNILTQYQGQACWAFKDPRSLFTLSAWRELVPDLCYIGTFRHPGAVAQSLHRRGGMPPQQAYDLWLRYNGKLTEYRRAFGFDLVCFDLEPAAYLQSAARAFRRLGLDVSPAALVFFEAELRSRTTEAMFAQPPSEAMAMYERLLELSA